MLMTRFQPDGPKSTVQLPAFVHFASLPVAGPVPDFMVARGREIFNRRSLSALREFLERFAGVNARAEDDVLIATVVVLHPTGAVAPGCRADIGTAVSTIAKIASSGRRTESLEQSEDGELGRGRALENCLRSES